MSTFSMLRRPAGRFAGALALAASLWLSGPAAAQTQPAQLRGVSLKEPDPNETLVTLEFSPTLPAYALAGNDNSRLELTVTGAAQALVSALARTQTAVLRDISLHPNGQNLSIVLTGAGDIHVVATPDGTNRLVLTITKARRGLDAAAAAAPGPGLPRALDPKAGEDGFELVPLKYADVSEVVGLLTEGVTVRSNDSFKPREPGFGTPGAGASSSYPTPAETTVNDRSLGEPVDSALAIDRRLNAIWIRGSADHIARVKAQIALIDIPVDTVVMETQVVELSETGARNIGVDFTNPSGEVAVATFQSGQYVQSNQYLSSVDGARSSLSSAAFQAALYAQVQKGQGRIVSKPRIAAQSGGEAKIVTGDALPILTAITLSGVNGVSQQVQYVNVGVTLQIAPRVGADGTVTSHVFCVVSSVTGYTQGYPRISQREAETSATVRDGDTFIIGGLTLENVIASRSQIPVLGDLPLVGQAFRTDNDSKAKTELYIIVTPHLVRRANLP